MKKMLLFGALVSALAVPAASSRVEAEPAKAPAHRVVFELTSDDPKAWESLLNNVENVQKALGPSSIVVVVHGKGLALLTTSKNAAVRQRLKQNADGGVVVAACENTMKRQNVKLADLVPFAKTVDSGVAEVVRKQESGWSYIRSAP